MPNYTALGLDRDAANSIMIMMWVRSGLHQARDHDFMTRYGSGGRRVRNAVAGNY